MLHFDAMSHITENDVLIQVSSQAFENTSTSVAASQMRNALNKLIDTVPNADDKKVRAAHHSARSWQC